MKDFKSFLEDYLNMAKTKKELINDNIKLVLINHGESETKQKFKETVEEKIDAKNVDVMDSKHFYRINAYGLVKKINTC